MVRFKMEQIFKKILTWAIVIFIVIVIDNVLNNYNHEQAHAQICKYFGSEDSGVF